jgi:hypothetical protein
MRTVIVADAGPAGAEPGRMNVPQLPQKRVSGTFSKWHCGHFMAGSLQRPV